MLLDDFNVSSIKTAIVYCNRRDETVFRENRSMTSPTLRVFEITKEKILPL